MSGRDPFQELEDALSFSPSPDFSARVRQQVAAEPDQPRFQAWRSVAAAAVVLVSVAGVVVTYRGERAPVVSVSRPPALAAAELVPEPRPGAAIAAAPVVVRARLPRVSPIVAGPVFEVIVPDDQRRALDHLLAAMRQGRATVPLPTAVEEEVTDQGERRLRAIVIEPMKLEPVPGAPGDPNKDPVKDPIK